MVWILKHLKQTFSAYRRNFGRILFAVILASIPSVIILSIGFLAVSDYSFPQASLLIKDTYLSEANGVFGTDPVYPAQIDSYFFAAFSLFSSIVSLYLLSGIYGVSISSIKGKAKYSDFFDSVRTRGLPLLISKVLLFGGVLLLIFPYILISTIAGAALGFSDSMTLIILFIYAVIMLPFVPFFMFVSPSVVQGKSVWAAFGESIGLGRKNYWEVIQMIIVIALLEALALFAGFLNYGVGIIFAAVFVSPVVAILISSVYLEKSGLEFSRGSGSSEVTVPVKPRLIKKIRKK